MKKKSLLFILLAFVATIFLISGNENAQASKIHRGVPKELQGYWISKTSNIKKGSMKNIVFSCDQLIFKGKIFSASTMLLDKNMKEQNSFSRGGLVPVRYQRLNKYNYKIYGKHLPTTMEAKYAYIKIIGKNIIRINIPDNVKVKILHKISFSKYKKINY